MPKIWRARATIRLGCVLRKASQILLASEDSQACDVLASIRHLGRWTGYRVDQRWLGLMLQIHNFELS